MAEEPGDNRTEAATPRRRESAREDGQVVFSPDLNSGILLFCIALGFWMFGGEWILRISGTMADQLRGMHVTEWGIGETMLSVRWLGAQIILAAGSIVAGAWILNAAISSAQAGPGFSSKLLVLNPDRLSLVQGWGRLCSVDGLIKGILAPLKLSMTIAVAFGLIWLTKDRISLSTRGSLYQSLEFAGQLLITLILILAGITLTLGAVDFLYRWYRHEQKLKMSRQELKQEHKEDQGDQQIKQKMRRAQQESKNRKTLKEVPSASAVITNPTHFAVAVRYDARRSSAPIVVAKGKNRFARQIIAIAQEHGVPVLERKLVARALFAMTDAGDEIPLELYRAVAEVLADVYRRKQAS